MKSRIWTIFCSAAVLLPVVFLLGADPGPRPAVPWEYGIYTEAVGIYDWQEAQRCVVTTNRTHFFERMGFSRGIEVDANMGRLTALTLNHLGTQGWVLVNVQPTPTGCDVYFFKRGR